MKDFILDDCPFCGCKAEIMPYFTTWRTGPKTLYRVVCTGCGVTTNPVELESDAAAWWNMRRSNRGDLISRDELKKDFDEEIKARFLFAGTIYNVIDRQKVVVKGN